MYGPLPSAETGSVISVATPLSSTACGVPIGTVEVSGMTRYQVTVSPADVLSPSPAKFVPGSPLTVASNVTLPLVVSPIGLS